MEWSRRKYNEYWDHYMPWLEDKYLAWRGENKASYVAKDKMKTHVVPDSGPTAGLNKLQDGLADGVGGQLDKGGLLGGVGDQASQQGVDRVERGEPQEAGKSWTQTLSGGFMGQEEKK